ncbi:MAG: potassium transporter TrkG [Candidatus Aminicenantales bacterium]
MQELIREKRPTLKRVEFKSVPFSLKNLSPIQFLVLGYFLTILVFTGLLMLPLSSASHQPQPFIDALFVACSGISTTGLTPVDVGRYYSVLGQIILMMDFQVGGIGYMAIVVWLAKFLKRKLSIRSHLIATESLAGARPGYNSHFFRNVIAYTLFFELTGGLILAVYWARQFPAGKALYLGFFHSVSAFCTAGFSLFSDSLASFQNSILVNSVINIVSLFGAIGFFALAEFAVQTGDRIKKRRMRRLSTHTRLAVLVTFIVISLGVVTIYFTESWSPGMGFFQRAMSSLFQAISASTTDGFNTMNIAAMSGTSLLLIILLMFIGASPGSTGGGIKTTTFGVLVWATKSQLQGQKDCNFFERRITDETIRKSYSIFILFICVMIIDLLIMSRTDKIPFFPLLFETGSALGNTGLSMGVTSNLSWVGKLLLSITMFIGRVGPITIGLALAGRRNGTPFQYANAEVFIG